MNIEALRTLVNIARCGNYRQVADIMNISQPAISKRIRVLEEHFRYQLVERAGASMRLTAAGQALLPYFQRILDTFDEAQNRLNEPEKWQGTIRLGAIDTIISTWLTDFLDLQQKRFPNIKLEVISAPTIDLLQELQHGNVDIIMVLGPSYDRALAEVPLCVMDVAFYGAPMGPNEPQEGTRKLSPEAVSEANIITFPRGSRPHVDVVQRMTQLKLTKMPTISGCSSLFTMRSMGERGLGVITLPRIMAEGTSLQELDLGVTLPSMSFAAVYEPAAAPPIYALTCALAAEIAADYAQRVGSGVHVPVPLAAKSAEAPTDT
ncbi:LysR family transcriptional regulator [Oceanicola sp. D3]|uniref:LysR family transcriptional regulator n=1 Tax=Oceanicola sp. D3 TaxID=2587163 RepID=UPI0011240147|nr:LysR family transcriptional regulator [Oceanicola sp. D3]QDC10613.1 LysR family transcriptional regulator [Oceanicola sp. D3]